MGKIKGWEKIEENPFAETWKNKTTFGRASIRVTLNNWMIQVRNRKGQVLHNYRKTKTQARKWVISWMKAHPRG